jgi:acyl-homoserine-lactone acylase
VRAADWGGLGFGQGWACARDHLPVLADQFVKVRGERARWHGAGPLEGHLASDFGYRVLDLRRRGAELLAAQPPEIVELLEGYTAGYNRSLHEQQLAGTLPEWCAGAAWMRPIEVADLAAYLVDVACLASGRNVAQLIGRAEAPGPEGPMPPSPMEALGNSVPASNGWAVGGDVSASGGGMVLANPHFPWQGEARFWECHLTIPGTYDVYGVCLLGAPGVQIGFNSQLAWTHTFSVGHRFTLYRLDLDPADPTRYRSGDDWRSMAATDRVAEVLGADGTVESVTRRLWTSHHGPMLNLPLLGWGNEVGFTYRDANLDNTRMLEQFLGMGRATDVASFRQVFHDVGGMPWANTLVADAAGDAWYGDHSATPALTPGASQRYRRRLGEDLVAALLAENRIALLDGSDPDDDWQERDGARSPGLEPPAAMPELFRRDVLVNANDSHWCSHWDERLEGFPVLCGPERSPQSLRTRQNLRQARALAERGDVTVDDLVDAVYDGPSLSAELVLDAVVERCRAAGTVTVEGHEADLDEVADVLEDWDRTVTLDARGAVLWRELMCGLGATAWRDAGALFAEPFDAEHPIDTPRTLAPLVGRPADDPVVHAAGHAVRVLAAAGVPLDASLREAQWAPRGSARVVVPGGGEGEGVMNVLVCTENLKNHSLEPVPAGPPPVAGRELTGLAEGGYQLRYGASFLMAVDVTPDGPRGIGLLAYGQSGDVRSPHHADGTVAFAQRQLRPLRFTDAEIDADPELTRVVLRRG